MTRRGRLAWIAVLPLAGGLAGAGPAAAHPALVQTGPAPRVVAERAPSAVVLSFSEQVIGRLSSVRMVGPDGRRVALSAPRARGRTLTASVRERLRPAVYDVRWVTVGDDGHTVSGDFRFGVPRPNGAAPPGVERLGAAAIRDPQSSGAEGAGDIAVRWLGLVAAGLLMAGALIRRRIGPEACDARWARAAPVALAAVGVAGAYAVLRAATAGSGASLGALADQPGGALALVRLSFVLAAAVALVRLPRRRDLTVGVAGYCALVSYALATHVQAVEGGIAAAALVQVIHVLAAGAWMGGLVHVALVERSARALRAFAPLAGVAVAALAVTGVLIALREVDTWYFLRWSDYGRIVIAKALLLVALGPLALASALAARRARAPGRAVRLEAAGALAIVLLAATLVGLPPGRGQLLPAERGNLLAGASFGTASTDRVTLPLTLAPARPGRNLLAVTPLRSGRGEPPAAVRAVAVELRCTCHRGAVRATLRRGPAGTWSASVALPARGTWYAMAAVDESRAIAPLPLAVGDPPTPGPGAREALMTADLSGPDALRCRGAAQGALLALGRFDANGGLPGGRKVSLRVEDDGGDPVRAGRAVRAARGRGAVALLAPCGRGAATAVRAAGKLPAIVGDPAVPVVDRPRVWRTAGDPRAEGLAVARYVLDQRAGSASSAVAYPVARDAARPVAVVQAGARTGNEGQRVAGLSSALTRAGIGVRSVRLGALRRTLDDRRYSAVVLDGDPGRLAAALRGLGRDPARDGVLPPPIVAASPLLDERFQTGAGTLGSAGAIGSPAEVTPASRDGLRYVAQQQAFFRPDRASIAGLRGYVAGLALGEGMRSGPGAGAIASRLRHPGRFTDALTATWRAAGPARGAELFGFLAPSFLPGNLLPTRLGGEAHSNPYFVGGAWTRRTSALYGPGG